MSSLLPFDFTEILQVTLERERREDDKLMHASSHLSGSLRHAQLDVAGAPKEEESFVRMMPLWIGSLLHEDIHRMLRKAGVPYMAEVNLTPWMPPGWGGTADALVWNHELKAFVLADVKSSKGESMKYILRDGAKEDHRLQTSLYWHAARRMGIPLAKKVGVLYLPKNDTRSRDEFIEPAFLDFDPYPMKVVEAEAKRRRRRVDSYLKSLPKPNPRPLEPEEFITDELEPGPVREQRLYLDRATETYDVKLVAPWYADYCSFGELCSCHEIAGKTTKIGFYDIDGDYIPRKGFEHIEPTVEPS